MPRGSIRKRERQAGTRYEAVVDLGKDPLTGRRRQRTRTYGTRREAQRALSSWLVEIDEGRAVDRSTRTLDDLLRYWLSVKETQLAPASVRLYRGIIANHLIPHLGAITMQALTPQAIQEFYAAHQAAGHSAYNVRLCHAILRQSYRLAVQQGLVPRNVVSLVEQPRHRGREMQVWSTEEARHAISAAGRHNPYGPVIPIALLSGLRVGEICGLRWSDVDLERGILHVRQTIRTVAGRPYVSPPKSRSSRRDVHVSPQAVDLLRAWRKEQNERRLACGDLWVDHGLVFTYATGKPLRQTPTLWEYHHKIIDLAGVTKIRFHDLRHTYATLALASGASIKAVSQNLGHSTTSMTMDIYAHVLPEQRVDVGDRVGNLLFPPDDGEHTD